MKIYHNPRCSKSRETLKLIQAAGIEPEVVLYLQDPPSSAELNAILSKLGINARDLLRKGEDAYKDNNLADKNLTDSQLVEFMVKYPKLIERPIVIKGEQAVLGRPPENVTALL